MSDDLIKRSDAIKAVREYAEEYTFNSYHKGMLKAVSIIADLPTADRPRGHWIDANENAVPLNKDGLTRDSAWCSVCGDWLTASDEYATRGWYCPNCGARMKGADDEV